MFPQSSHAETLDAAPKRGVATGAIGTAGDRPAELD